MKLATTGAGRREAAATEQQVAVREESSVNELVAGRIRSNPQFHELVSRRGRLGWLLSAVMLAIYFGFIMTIAFAPAALGVPMTPGSVITVGIPVGLAIIALAFILTGIYVHKANTEFDRLTQAIRQAAEAAPARAAARRELKEAV